MLLVTSLILVVYLVYTCKNTKFFVYINITSIITLVFLLLLLCFRIYLFTQYAFIGLFSIDELPDILVVCSTTDSDDTSNNSSSQKDSIGSAGSDPKGSAVSDPKGSDVSDPKGSIPWKNILIVGFLLWFLPRIIYFIIIFCYGSKFFTFTFVSFIIWFFVQTDIILFMYLLITIAFIIAYFFNRRS
jgi:hypothetical protein